MMSSVDRSVSTRHASLIPPATERTTRHLTTSPPSTPSSYRVSWACPRAPTMGRATARDSPSHATLVARWTGRRKGSTAQTRRTLARGVEDCMEDFLSCGSSDVDCPIVDCPTDRSDVPQRCASPEVTTSEKNASVSPHGDSPVMHSPVAMTTASATAITGSALWLSTSVDAAANISTSTSASVRELEEVMNKHLPGDVNHMRTSSSSRADCSHPAQLPKHKSAIQWVGSQSQALDHLPATNLLRSFYTSRESVIRSTVYSHRTPQYYSDMQSSLLTPPGGSTGMAGDTYKDMVSPFVPTQMGVSKASAGSLAYNLMAAYPTNPINVSMASSLSDSYGLATPPSSVSPQDSYSNPFANQLLAETSSGRKYRQFCHEASGIPIKPQAYPLPAHATLPTYEHAKDTLLPLHGVLWKHICKL